MTNERERDQRLAAFTDMVLEGASPPQEQHPPLADTVELLARTMKPEPAPAHLRLRVLRMIQTEWERPSPSLGFAQQILRLFRQPQQRWAWAAIAALLLLTIAAAVLVPAGWGETTGTVIGGAGTVALIVFLMLVGVLIAAWFISRR